MPNRRISLIGLLLVAGCRDTPESRSPVAPALAPTEAAPTEATAVPGAARCPAGITVPRTVTPGTERDANGNGVVCDRNDGTPAVPLITTYDDGAF